MESDAISSQKALGAFLRAHRERVTPEMLGLPTATRRRTSGLRREELAQISGISATWYTWIEQGREVSISPIRWHASPPRYGWDMPSGTICSPWHISPILKKNSRRKRLMPPYCKACIK